MKKKHESYGMITISKFQCYNSEFFGSDLVHNGGISISISNADKERKLSSEWFHSGKELIRIEMSYNQFVDAITSAMNTQGVPCTILRFDGKQVPQISHIEDKKEQFSNDMEDTHVKYIERINYIIQLLENENIGKKKIKELKHEVEVLKSHIISNTNFVMKCFNEAMDKTVSEAKHTISNYIDSKVNTLGIQGLKDELQLSIENKSNDTNGVKK